jgi:Brp/Blh family beta-carotene 15,15'-monooxygenase
MTRRYPLLYQLARGMVIFLVLFAFLFPNVLAGAELFIAAALIVLAGIPHGATDHLIFLQLRRPFLGSRGIEQFYVNYLLLMAIYSVLWWLMPVVALAVFMLLSIYHFGQSNWNYVAFANKTQATLTYLLWGSFVLVVPIVWHFDEAAGIIASITRSEVASLSIGWRQAICLTLLIGNIWLTIYLRAQGMLSRRHFRDEVINLVVLGMLFFFAPLLLGFVFYFVFWHSLSSMADQIRFFNKENGNYTWKNYARQALPLSVVAVGGLALLYVVQHQLGLRADVGLLFIFISVVTLPHMILIELLYGEWEASAPQSEQRLAKQDA